MTGLPAPGGESGRARAKERFAKLSYSPGSFPGLIEQLGCTSPHRRRLDQ
jgi:hypothetical protein